MTVTFMLACVAALLAVQAPAPARIASGPLALHPDNPHYFLWRGKPAVLIGSGEHYGALLNLDFDYRRYFDTLAADGMMLTRVFSGAYVEPEGAFKIARNTLAPLPERFISPWARSSQPGYANGGNRFDLGRWDDGYFRRLKDLVAYAAEKEVVVELTLFCPMYEDTQWNLSPMNARNNISGVGDIPRLDVHTLDKHGGLLPVQQALTRKLVTELNPFDNVMFEIINEPYTRGVPMAWQHAIADVIIETERGLPKRHLITENVANKTARIEAPHPGVSVFNFHYASPPDAVPTNYHLNKVIGDNETGFRGTGDAPYRLEAWDFIISGGGLFNHLDYSFAAGYETGTFAYPASQPGGGGASFRRQMKILRDFVHGFDFVRMRPDNSIIRGVVPTEVSARALVEPGRAIALFVRGGGVSTVLSVDLSPGTWRAEWIDTKTGATAHTTNVSGGGVRPLEAPVYDTDIALRLNRN
jgi:hypothetical protein